MGTHAGDTPRYPSISPARVQEDYNKQDVNKGFVEKVMHETLKCASIAWNPERLLDLTR